MNELTTLADLRADVPAMSAQAHQRGRTRLTAAMTTDSGRPRLVPRRRLAVGLVAGLLLTAATTTITVIGTPGPKPASAADVLRRAAAALDAERDLAPRPDQYIYQEVRQQTTALGPHFHVWSWVAVDGRRPGRMRWVDESPTCRRSFGPDARVAVVGPDGTAVYLTPGPDGTIPGVDRCAQDREVPVYDPAQGLGSAPYSVLATLPTDPDALLRTLGADPAARTPPSAVAGPGPITREVQILTLARMVVAQMPNAQRAALFRALATAPGITLHNGVTDASGRTGTGVGFDDPRLGRVILVFDKADRYLGEVILSGNQIAFRRAVLRTAIVDHVGQLPS